jgi:hypothetical protein
MSNTKQKLKNLCWTRFSWLISETVYGSQTIDPYSKIGQTKAQYNDFNDFDNLKSLDRRFMNPKALNAQ